MDLRTRLIAPSFRFLSDGRRGDFDLDAFIKRLLLFETYIVDSQGLTEIPYLIQVFTFDGLLALLESGALRLNCYPKHIGSLGPSTLGDKIPKDGIRPPFHYSIGTITPAEFYEYVNGLLGKIEPQLELSARRIVRLRKAIYRALEPPGDDTGSFAIKATKDDLVSSPNLLARAVVISIYKQLGIQASFSDIEIAIEYDSDSDFDFKAISNIQERFDIDQLSAHKVIEGACLAIASRNSRIDQMRTHSALTGFRDIDLPIFGDKLEFLASLLSPEIEEGRFQRVSELVGLPQIKDNHEVYIDAKQLLKIRQSTEAIEFRHWLAATDAMSDGEIAHQVHSLSKTIGRVVGGRTGKSIRFLITNSLSFVPVVGQIISIPLSVLDSFLLDKIFPRSGVTAFIDDMFPSLFENPKP